jgi:predicted ATPase with chaperone activity
LANVRVRIEAAREHQWERFGDSDLACNADMRPAEVREYCQFDETCNSLMRTAMNQMPAVFWRRFRRAPTIVCQGESARWPARLPI